MPIPPARLVAQTFSSEFSAIDHLTEENIEGVQGLMGYLRHWRSELNAPEGTEGIWAADVPLCELNPQGPETVHRLGR